MTDRVQAHQYLKQIATTDRPPWAAGSGCLIIYMVMDGPGIVRPSNSSPRRATGSRDFICGLFPVRKKAFQPCCRQKGGKSAALAKLPSGSHFKFKKIKNANTLTSGFLMLPPNSQCTRTKEETQVTKNLFLNIMGSPSLFCKQNIRG